MKLEITGLSINGEGIGHDANGPVYVPFSLPGEVVTGDILDRKINNPKILLPSESRVRPPCPHFKTCGGCALQHVSDQYLAKWKSEVVKIALAAQGMDVEIDGITSSFANTRRRATFGGRRTKKDVQVGFHARASDTLVSIENCTILHPEILKAIPLLETLTKLGATRTQSVSLSITRSIEGMDISVTKARIADPQLLESLGKFCEEHQLARISWNGEIVALRKPPFQQFGTARVAPPPTAFLQATLEGEQALVDRVLEITAGAKSVADLFAGCGTFSLPLAQGAKVLAVESDLEMLKALDAGWRLALGVKNVTCSARDLFHNPILPEDLRKFNAIVLDPPRAGAKAQCQALAESVVPVLAYVSCNPVSFARDARILVNGGYSIGQVQVVDQFRWSPHVELVAGFYKNP